MLLYTLKENKNEKLPDAKGLWYAYAITTQMMDVDGLAAHMAGHNTPFSKGAIKGMITEKLREEYGQTPKEFCEGIGGIEIGGMTQ